MGIQLITSHLYLFDPCGILPSVTSAELRQLGLTVIYLSDTSGADSRESITKINGGGREEELVWVVFFNLFFSFQQKCHALNAAALITHARACRFAESDGAGRARQAVC